MENLNIINLFDNIKVENDKRLSQEDNFKMDEYRKILFDMREKFKLYLEFYKNNPILNIDYNNEVKEINGADSYNGLRFEFVEKIIFRETNTLISRVYYYFRDKYNVTLETMKHDEDYYEGRPTQMEKNFNWYMTISVDDLIDDIFIQLGNVTFEDKALNECKEEVLKHVTGYKAETVTVKNGKISLKDFVYYSYWGKDYGEYRIEGDSKKGLESIFKLLTYYKRNTLENDYEFIIEQVGAYRNTYIGEYEIGDQLLKSFKTFKNGKVEFKFNNGLDALNFAKKYLNYQE